MTFLPTVAVPRASRALAALLVLAVAACTSMTDPVIQKSRDLFASGRGEEALALLDSSARANPQNQQYRGEYFRERDLLIAQWIGEAETLRLAEQFGEAAARYRKVLQYDPENVRARTGIAQLALGERHRALVADAEELVRAEKYAEAEQKLRPVLTDNPSHREARRLQRAIEEKTAKPAVPTQLRTTDVKPVTIELKDVTMRALFDVLGRAARVNFLFDKDVKSDQKTSLAVRDTPMEEVIRLVLASNSLDYKVLNENTALVYPNTAAKQREYQEMVVKSFYLANADAKQTASMIRAILKTRDVYVDEKLNIVVMRDTPRAIRLAEKLIATQDLAEPEVMLEVEVLEVGTNRLLDLGLRFPDSVAWSVQGSGNTPGQLTLPEVRSRSSSLVRLNFTNPLFLLNLRQQDGRTNVLANPRIRVKNKEKARIHIGDRVPVITTTAAVAGGFVSESVSYLDVGLKLEVEPLIYLEDEVGINVSLEVSNIVREVRGASGSTLTYQIGTRNTATVLRLHDGETQVLAGLINDEDRRAASRVPGLGELPVVGRLFSQTNDNRSRTEIVLLITPRILRTLQRADARAVEFPAGTEASVDGGGPIGAGPSSAPPPSPPVALPPPTQPSQPPAAPATAPQMVPFGGVQQPRTR